MNHMSPQNILLEPQQNKTYDLYNLWYAPKVINMFSYTVYSQGTYDYGEV